MSSPQVDLKNQWIAATLAFLIPGAGHLYQGRRFKAVLYSVCILGTFFGGMALGDWQVVYLKWESGKREIGYLSQVLVGLPALPAIIQRERYKSAQSDFNGDDKQEPLSRSMATSFQGRMIVAKIDDSTQETVADEEMVEGELQLEPVEGSGGYQVTGRFLGSIQNENDIKLTLGGWVKIGPKLCASEEIPNELRFDDEQTPIVFSSRRRYLQCPIVDDQGDRVGYLEGTIPRGFWDWFEVPPEEAALQHLHGKLGRFFELAKVFTWIAGLLNLLAIWDALDGPAYGYGYEMDQSDEASRDSKDDKGQTAGSSSSEATADDANQRSLSEPTIAAKSTA